MLSQFPSSRLLAVSLPLLLSATASHAAPLDTRGSSSVSSVIWQNCTADFLGPIYELVGLVPPGLECGSLSVPIDWSDPGDETVDLALTRLPASNPDERIGNLILNNGGPGASPNEYVAGIAYGAIYMSPDVMGKFDLIGLDPRGVGLSSPVQCDADIWNERVSLFPTDEAEFEKLVAHNKAFGESCLNLTGNLLYYVDTKSVAYDLEAVRQALGDEKLNFFGLSYGTQIGATYAELFPDKIRSMTLDAIVDHGIPEVSAYADTTNTVETEFDRFFEWCETDPASALYGLNVSSAFDELIEKAFETPIPAPECNGTCRANVTAEEILFTVAGSLIFKNISYPYNQFFTSWYNVSTWIAAATEGDASGLSYPLALDNYGFTTAAWGGIPVSCLDWHAISPDLSSLLYRYDLANSIAPHSHGAHQFWQIETQCIGWPAPITNPPARQNITDTPSLLLVNALYDPETSYTWAVGLMEQVENATLVTRVGDGHTSYALMGAASAIMDAYMVNLTVPEQDTIVLN